MARQKFEPAAPLLPGRSHASRRPEVRHPASFHPAGLLNTTFSPAADRPARDKLAEPAHEQQWRFATFLETGDVRAVQINFSGAAAGGDVDFGQTAAAVGERDPAGDFKFAEPPGKDGVFRKTRTVLAPATGRHRFFVMPRNAGRRPSGKLRPIFEKMSAPRLERA
jgi:hypothetical protein